MDAKEIELFEAFAILWKRKWLIFISSAIFAAAAGTLSFLVPPVWEVDSVIDPGRIHSETAQESFDQLHLVNGIIGLISDKAYHQRLAAEFNLEARHLPAIGAFNANTATLLKLVVRDRDADKARQASYALFRYLKLDLDSKQAVDRDKIAAALKEIEVGQAEVTRDLETLESRLGRLRKSNLELEQNRQDVLRRIKILTEEQSKIIDNRDKGDNEADRFFRNSAALRDHTMYYETLTKSRDDIQHELRSLFQKRQEIRQRAQTLETTQDELTDKKRRLTPARFITEPYVSAQAVPSRRTLIILVAGFLGMILSSPMVLFIDALEKRKANLP